MSLHPPSAPLRIFLFRHGQTEWTVLRRLTGRTDLPLTAAGEDEVRPWSEPLRLVPFTRVLSSPRQRARQTCVLVGLPNAVEIDPDLAEWDYGDYEGLRTVDIRAVRQDWNVFQDGCPNGEDPAAITARADRLIARLRAMDGNVALFSHGHFGPVLAMRWIGLPLREARGFPKRTASLSILGYAANDPEVPVIDRWNSLPHL